MGALNPKGVRVPLKNGDAMRVLFDIDSLINLEEQFGSVLEVMQALATKSFGTGRYILWVAGSWIGDPARAPESLEDVGHRMDVTKMRDLVSLITSALDEALGLEDETEETADPTQPGADTRSPSFAQSPALSVLPPVSATP